MSFCINFGYVIKDSCYMTLLLTGFKSSSPGQPGFKASFIAANSFDGEQSCHKERDNLIKASCNMVETFLGFLKFLKE